MYTVQLKKDTKENETVKLVFVETSHGSTFVTIFSHIAAFLSLISWLVSHCLSFFHKLLFLSGSCITVE